MTVILSQLLYIFQSEHYDRKRFFFFAYTHVQWWKLAVRGKIDWTLRTKLLGIMTAFIFIVCLCGPFFLFSSAVKLWSDFQISILFFLLLGGSIILLPVYIIISDFLLSPLVYFQKQKILKHAKNLLEKTKIISIGITGSYGKTTLKNILDSVLSQKFSVFVVPGNINTDLGIANYLLAHRSQLENSDVLLMEMGAYHPKEIESICDFVQPDYSFLCAIAPVHLERFGSIESITTAKFEIVSGAKIMSYVNVSNDYIQEHVKTFEANAEIKNLEMDIDVLEEKKVLRNITYLPEFSGIEFEWMDTNVAGENIPVLFTSKLIAKHIISSVAFILPLAKKLGLSTQQMQKGISQLDHIPHRLAVTKNKKNGVTVIDDSYNGNFDGFVSALETLNRSTGRTIVLTPGIVELGNMQKEVHEKLAQQYIDYEIDMVLLVENSNTKYITEYFNKNNFSNFKNFETVFLAHQSLPSVLKKGDTILFQNDLPDNYS